MLHLRVQEHLAGAELGDGSGTSAVAYIDGHHIRRDAPGSNIRWTAWTVHEARVTVSCDLTLTPDGTRVIEMHTNCFYNGWLHSVGTDYVSALLRAIVDRTNTVHNEWVVG